MSWARPLRKRLQVSRFLKLVLELSLAARSAFVLHEQGREQGRDHDQEHQGTQSKSFHDVARKMTGLRLHYLGCWLTRYHSNHR